MRLFANNATSSLASGVSDSDNTLLLATGDGARFPSPTAGDHFSLTLTQGIGLEESWEIVKVTARSGDTLTVTRAQEGTSAAAWPAGAKAELRLTKEVMEDVARQSISVIAYDDRATLRSTPAIHGKQSIVEGLGLFAHHVGSDEPDDDETCFATATGRWLLALPHPDLLAAWALPDDEVAEATHLIAVDAHAIAHAAASIPNRIITAAASSALTTIAAVSKASFTAAVAGAKAGSAAFATPLGNLDARLAISARVTSDGTVTVTLNNPSAAASAAGGIPAAWQIFVFNQE